MRKFRALPLIAAALLFTPLVTLHSMDKARVESRVDEAVRKYGVSGKDVLVAIFDRGVDWKNNDFRNPDGTTRIEAILDLSDSTGANDAGNKFKQGTLYTKQQINAALEGGTALAHRDAVGHGTTTTGIAAGNGRNSRDWKYRGEAPKAFVKLKEGEQATAAELLQFLRGKLSKIELPAEIEFREELPKTMVGKLSKKELRAEAKAKG